MRLDSNDMVLLAVHHAAVHPFRSYTSLKTTQPYMTSPAMARHLSTPLVMLAALSLTAMQGGCLARQDCNGRYHLSVSDI